jgi:hypothetical protein
MAKYNQKSRRTVKTCTYLAGAVSATSDEEPIFTAPFNCEVVGAYATDTAGFAVSGTDNWTILLNRKGATGGDSDAIATLTTSAGSTAFVPKTLGTLTNTFIPKGSAITLTMTKNASGATTSGTVITVQYREI